MLFLPFNCYTLISGPVKCCDKLSFLTKRPLITNIFKFCPLEEQLKLLTHPCMLQQNQNLPVKSNAMSVCSPEHGAGLDEWIVLIFTRGQETLSK